MVCLLVSVVVVVGGGVLWQQHGVQWRVAGRGGAGRGPSVGRTASVTVPGSDDGCHLQVMALGGGVSDPMKSASCVSALILVLKVCNSNGHMTASRQPCQDAPAAIIIPLTRRAHMTHVQIPCSCQILEMFWQKLARGPGEMMANHKTAAGVESQIKMFFVDLQTETTTLCLFRRL